MNANFITDLHGNIEKYQKLFSFIEKEKPELVFFGGDIGGHYARSSGPENNFYYDILFPKLDELKQKLTSAYPKIFIIMGNDDPKRDEKFLVEGESQDLLFYIHSKFESVGDYTISGYSYNPPSPFQLKDWEKYDVSRYVDPGCISPEDGFYTVEIPQNNVKFATIQKDLKAQFAGKDLSKTIVLFHTPPHKTNLDKINPKNKTVDHAPIDLNVGSIAVRKFIEQEQPYLTLHGHIHESTEITGKWKDRLNKTLCFNAAHAGEELSIIKFDAKNPGSAERILI